ncbi:MAG: heavy-metal-associated domain-containing protein [Candidatus Scatosoma sp.]
MKKVIKVKDLCCTVCCERLSQALELKDGVLKANADKKRNAVFVETLSYVSDDFLRAAVEKEGFEVLCVERRKGLFC